MNKKLKKVGLVALLVVAVGGVAVLVAHDQMTRHQRDLFSPGSFGGWRLWGTWRAPAPRWTR